MISGWALGRRRSLSKRLISYSSIVAIQATKLWEGMGSRRFLQSAISIPPRCKRSILYDSRKGNQSLGVAIHQPPELAKRNDRMRKYTPCCDCILPAVHQDINGEIISSPCIRLPTSKEDSRSKKLCTTVGGEGVQTRARSRGCILKRSPTSH